MAFEYKVGEGLFDIDIVHGRGLEERTPKALSQSLTFGSLGFEIALVTNHHHGHLLVSGSHCVYHSV